MSDAVQEPATNEPEVPGSSRRHRGAVRAVVLVVAGVLVGVLAAGLLLRPHSSLVAPNPTGDRVAAAQAPSAFAPATTAGHLVPLSEHVPPVEVAVPAIAVRSTRWGPRRARGAAAVRSRRPHRPRRCRRPGTEPVSTAGPAGCHRPWQDRFRRHPRSGLRTRNGRRTDCRRPHPGPATRTPRPRPRRPRCHHDKAGQRPTCSNSLSGIGRRHRAHTPRDGRQHLSCTDPAEAEEGRYPPEPTRDRSPWAYPVVRSPPQIGLAHPARLANVVRFAQARRACWATCPQRSRPTGSADLAGGHGHPDRHGEGRHDLRAGHVRLPDHRRPRQGLQQGRGHPLRPGHHPPRPQRPAVRRRRQDPNLENFDIDPGTSMLMG